MSLFSRLTEYITFQKVKKARRWQAVGMFAGILYSILILYSFQQPHNEGWLNKGPLTAGHQDLQCGSCHSEAEGSIRQQLQAKVQYELGFRHSDAEFGLLKVDNASCLNCHERPDDRHPVYRFKEPRFAELRQTLDASQCGSCHTEHTAILASIADIQFCSNCHEDLKMKNDPLDIPHQELVGKALWNTCMQCHDYHGNHKMIVPVALKDTIPAQAILEYIRQSEDPYSLEKYLKASTNDKK